MACRAVRQRPLNSFQMVFKQDATIVGDAFANCNDSQCGYKRIDKLVTRYSLYDIKVKRIMEIQIKDYKTFALQRISSSC